MARVVRVEGAFDGVRIVAMTFQPREWKRRAEARPMPEEEPVIKIVFEVWLSDEDIACTRRMLEG